MMRCQTPQHRAFTLIDLTVTVALIALLTGLLLPTTQFLREGAARTQTINNLKQIGTATHNFAGTYNTKMPINGYFGMRYSSVFGHLLPFVEQDNVYKLIGFAVNNAIPPRIQNAVRTYDAGPAAYRGAAIPSYQAPSDLTVAATNGVAADGSWKGTTSFASNGLLFNGRPGTIFSPLEYTPDEILPLAPPRLPATFVAGTSNVVMFATRYATCDGVDNYWASPQRTYFFNYYPQTQPNLARGPGTNTVACKPLAVQGFSDRGPMVCMGDCSVRSVFPNVSATNWRIVLNPTSTEILPPDWEE